MNQNFCIIIPSRIGSTRLQNKPLIDLHGQSLIQRVFNNASLISSKTYVATDSKLIKDNLKNITENVIMTSEDHISGTDRICEAATKLNIEDDTLILNLQGDEPFIPKDLLLKVIDDFYTSSCDVITVSNKLTSDNDLSNPNCVLVEVDDDSFATKFSRVETLNNPKRHVGIYGYSFKTLKALVNLEPTKNELTYKLEQLRFIENGFSIYVSNYNEEIPGGIDTPDDVKNANIYLSK
tara:strand:+ start:19077 stop:19787 length:711 start_codon:yes stop_codon:yes gene_type:complete